MPFDRQRWEAPAMRGEAAGPVLDLSIAIQQIRLALAKLAEKSDVDLSPELMELKRMDETLFERFVAATGWSPNEP